MKLTHTISFIAAVVINVQSNHNVEHELTELSKWYDGIVDIAENKYGQDCQDAINKVMDLLCDGFQFCKSDGFCIDKNQYKTSLEQNCGSFKEIDYEIDINPSHQYAPTYTSLTCEWTIISMDDCTVKKTEEHKIYYNDQGKITKLYETLNDETSRECPKYDGEPDPMPIPSQEYVQDPSSTIAECMTEDHYDDIKQFLALEVNIADNKDGDCQNDIDNLMSLLCDGFKYCYTKDGYTTCYDKAESKQILLNECGDFKEVNYLITYMTCDAVTIEWNLVLQNDCTKKETEERKFVYNDRGLITRIDVTSVIEPSLICPQPDGYEPEPEPSQYPDNDYIRIRELYDVWIDILTDNKDEDCESRINDLRNLFADDFSCNCMPYIPFSDDMNKDEIIAAMSNDCNRYKSVGDFIDITSNSNSYDPSISLTVKLIFVEKDGCQITRTNDETVTYNDQGLITKIDITSEVEETEICPQYGYEPEPEPIPSQYHEPEEVDEYADEPQGLPPIANTDYSWTSMNEPVMIDVLDNDIDPDQPELSGKQSLDIEGYTQGNKGIVKQFGNKLMYTPIEDECGADQFTYTIIDNDDGLTASANVNIDIVCPTPEYDAEPVGYGDDPRIDTPPIPAPDYDGLDMRKYKNLKIDVPVGDDPLYGGYIEITNPEELAYIEADLLKLKKQIIGDKDVDDISLVETYAKDLSEEMIRYRCFIEFIGPIPPAIKQDDGSWSLGLAAVLSTGYIEYDVYMKDDDNKYGSDPEPTPVPTDEGCPKTQPTLGASESCSFEGKCYYGEETCCGETHPAIFCNCVDGYTMCGYTDACFGGCLDDQVPDTEYGSESPLDELINEYQQQPTPTKLDDGYIQETTEPQYGSRLPPIARDDSITIEQNEMTRIYVLANDKDPNNPELPGRDALNIISNTDGNKGKVFISATNKRLRYVPYDGECGDDSFEYTVINDYGLTDTAKVYVNIDCAYIVEETHQPITYATEEAGGAPVLIKMNREHKLRAFYKAAFDCRLKQNSGNTELLDTFMSYLCESAELCVVKDNGVDETCYNKNEIREMMADRYVDDNESIDYNIDILENDGNKIEAKCTSRRRKSNGCIVIKEEYDTCLFNADGSIKEFKVLRSNREIDCKEVNNYEDE